MEILDEIPTGFYCHDDTQSSVCKHWYIIESAPAQQNGGCSKYCVEDNYVDSISLLWDQCRCAECMEEYPYEWEDYER